MNLLKYKLKNMLIRLLYSSISQNRVHAPFGNMWIRTKGKQPASVGNKMQHERTKWVSGKYFSCVIDSLKMEYKNIVDIKNYLQIYLFKAKH